MLGFGRHWLRLDLPVTIAGERPLGELSGPYLLARSVKLNSEGAKPPRSMRYGVDPGNEPFSRGLGPHSEEPSGHADGPGL